MRLDGAIRTPSGNGKDSPAATGEQRLRAYAAGAPGATRQGPAILVVEDERGIGTLVATYLRRAGFTPLWVRSGEAALLELPRHPVALVILDLELPDIDGLEVCRRIGRRVPVIMLTARDDETDRIAGLHAGADDYLAKPFSPRELVARVRAVLRRTAPSEPKADVVTLGPVRLCRSTREVTVGTRAVELAPKEFELLGYLMERPGIVVSRATLLEDVWGFLAPGETRTIEVHVGQVRKKLGDPSLIRTVRGVGYEAVAG
jgi:DNA-binding response OmpR family regulator